MPEITTVDSAFITSIARVDERLVTLLGLGKALSLNELADLSTMSAAE